MAKPDQRALLFPSESDQGIANIDPVKRKEVYSRLQDIWYEDAVAVPLYQQIDVRAYRDNVIGYVPNPLFNQEWEDLKSITKD